MFANIIPPTGLAALLTAWGAAVVVGLWTRTMLAAIIVAAIGTIAAILMALQSRSNRRYLLALHAESRRAARDRATMRDLVDDVAGIARDALDVASRTQTAVTRVASEASARAEELRASLPRPASAPVATTSPVITPLDSRRSAELGPSWTVRIEDAAEPIALVPLAGSPAGVIVPVRGAGRLALELELRSSATAVDANAARLKVRFRDVATKQVGAGVSSLALRYSPGAKSLVSIDVPANAASMVLSIEATPASGFKVVNRLRLRELDAGPRRPRPAREIRVAMVADPFTFNSFKYECDAVSIHPEKWRQQFEEHAPELFFCESAWEGTTPDREWRGRVYASNAWQAENRTHLLEILQYCKSHGIPTVFWNKEDPSHYDDRRHDFVSTAILFDHVLTTDAGCVNRYRNEWGARSVAAVPFASQPRLYNPAGSKSDRKRGVVFAGSWYANHAGRTRAMSSILDSLVASDIEVVIYDRFYGQDDPHHVFPKKYQHLTKPAVSHATLASKYKEYDFGLNFNTETQSSTMFARRVFELAMSGSVVLTNHARGVQRYFGDQVIYMDRAPERLWTLSRRDVTEMRSQALENVLQNHTYARRFEQILDIVGLEYSKPDDRVDAIAVVASDDDARLALTQVRSLGGRVGELTMVTGREVRACDVQEYYRRYATNTTCVVAPDYAHDALVGLPSERPLVLLSRITPVPRDLDRARLHLQYAQRPLAVVGNGAYEHGPVERDLPIFFARDNIAVSEMLAGTVHKNTYRI